MANTKPDADDSKQYAELLSHLSDVKAAVKDASKNIDEFAKDAETAQSGQTKEDIKKMLATSLKDIDDTEADLKYVLSGKTTADEARRTIQQLTAKKNLLAFKNLPPGNYTQNIRKNVDKLVVKCERISKSASRFKPTKSQK